MVFNKLWNFIKTKRDLIYILGIILISSFLYNQCNRNNILNYEINRLENNILAVSDTLVNYKDELERNIAEKHALVLTQEEMQKNIDLLKDKNKEYLAYINSNIGIIDTIHVPTYIEKPFEMDSTCYIDRGVIKFNNSETFGKSSRDISVFIPYTFDTELKTGNADISLSQNIYVESIIEREKKSGEVFIKLITDYPNAIFNSGNGIIVSNSSSYKKNVRKTKGIGIGIGPSIGLNYDMLNKKIVPTVGFNITLGFTYTPKWTQW